MSIAITALLLVTVAALFLYGVKADREGTFFMSKDFTTTMKGLAAIVVVFVHFPTEYQNKLQDLVGSFAYVAVTVFFLFSAYGMLLSVDRNERYLKTFWINRIAGLVVPNWMVNFALAAIIFLFASKSVEMDNVFQLNTYVWVLLGYCVVFYLVELMSKRYRLFSRRIAEGYPNCRIVGTLFIHNDPEVDERLLREFLGENPGITAIYLVNPGNYEVCRIIRALDQKKEISIITNDLVPVQEEMVRNGIISATITQEPEKQGSMPLEALFRYLAFGALPENKVYHTQLDIRIASNL